MDTDEIDPLLPRITLAEMLDDLNIEDVEMSEVWWKKNTSKLPVLYCETSKQIKIKKNL